MLPRCIVELTPKDTVEVAPSLSRSCHALAPKAVPGLVLLKSGPCLPAPIAAGTEAGSARFAASALALAPVSVPAHALAPPIKRATEAPIVPKITVPSQTAPTVVGEALGDSVGEFD